MTTASCLLWQPTEVCKQHPTIEGPGMGKQREGMGIVCLSDEPLKATDFSKHQENTSKTTHKHRGKSVGPRQVSHHASDCKDEGYGSS